VDVPLPSSILGFSNCDDERVPKPEVATQSKSETSTCCLVTDNVVGFDITTICGNDGYASSPGFIMSTKDELSHWSEPASASPCYIVNPEVDLMALFNPLDGSHDYILGSMEKTPFSQPSPQDERSKLERVRYLREELHRLELECALNC